MGLREIDRKLVLTRVIECNSICKRNIELSFLMPRIVSRDTLYLTFSFLNKIARNPCEKLYEMIRGLGIL